MAGYAENTTVPSDRSRAEIEKTLARYGADEFAYATRAGLAVIQFTAESRTIRFTLPLPDPKAEEFILTPSRKWARSDSEAAAAYEKAVRQRWRALALVVKAKLEAVNAGIVTFEQEFMPHILMPGGQTVYEQAAPAIASAYRTGAPTPLLQLGAES
ncbi:MAG: hypothetical protein ACLGHM_09740 [Actinomycetes bacterium]